MKYTICLALILSITFGAVAEDHWDDSEVSGDDLVELLELRVSKYHVHFDEPQLVTLHFESPYQTSELSLEVPDTKVSVLVYMPKESNEMTLKISGQREAKLSFGSYDQDKARFQTVEYRGALQIIGKEAKEAEDTLYRIWVTTKEP